MTSSHLFYIPLMILVGLVVGFILGRKAGIGYILAKTDREQRRTERRQKREQAAAEAAVEESELPPDGSPT